MSLDGTHLAADLVSTDGVASRVRARHPPGRPDAVRGAVEGGDGAPHRLRAGAGAHQRQAGRAGRLPTQTAVERHQGNPETRRVGAAITV